MGTFKYRRRNNKQTLSKRGVGTPSKNACLPLPLGPVTASTLTPSSNITVTRIQAQAQLVPSGCSTNAVIQITDGTSAGTRDLSLSSAANDSGVLSLNYTAGTPLKIGVLSPVGCKVSPASVNIVVQYQGR